MRTTTGVITIVQEGRFRLVDDDGRPQLFVLSHSSAVEPQDLPPLQRRQARVSVAYEKSPDLIASVAHSIILH